MNHFEDTRNRDMIYEKNMFLDSPMKTIRRRKSKIEKELLANYSKNSEKTKKNKHNLERLIDEILNHKPE